MEKQIVECSECQTKNPSDSVFCNKCGTRFGLENQESISFTKTLVTPSEELTKGATLAERYEVVEQLGKGGMGFVYKVFDTKIQEDVALKVLKPEVAAHKDTITRFSNELKYARRITHKNVCRMHDINEAAGTNFITMEYVEGETLKSVIKRMGKLKLGNVLSIALQVTDGLAEAHSLGIVHRDLKPQNIMIDKEGNAKIMDFGIARFVEGKGPTVEGMVIGTPEYMSPEQVDGKKADQRSDIYSLGVILYEMVTGKVPFSGDTAFSLAVKHKSEEPKDPRQANPQLPEGMARAILRCMEKDGNRRYQSAEELLAVLMASEELLPEKERVVKKLMPRIATARVEKFRLKKILAPSLAVLVAVAAGIFIWRLLTPSKTTIFPAPDRLRVAVVPFRNISGDQSLDSLSLTLSSMFTADLMQSKYISVVEESQVDRVLRRMKLDETADLSQAHLKDFAKQTLATHILKGNFIKLGEQYRVTALLHKAGTSEPIASESADGEGDEDIFLIVDELTEKFKPHFNLKDEEIASDFNHNISDVTTPNLGAFQFYTEGNIALNNMNWDRAIEAYRNAILLDSDFAMAYRRLSGVYNMLRELTDNYEYNEKSREFREKASEAMKRRPLSEREQLFIEAERSGNSLAAFEKILELYPDHVQANTTLGIVYCRDFAVYKRAQEYLEIPVRFKTADFTAYNWLGISYEAQGEYEKARGFYEGGLESYSESPPFYMFMARAYLKEREFDKALSWCEKGFKLNPAEFLRFGTKGDTLLFMGNFQAAEEKYHRQLLSSDLKKDRRNANLDLIHLYRTQGRFDDTIVPAENAKQVGIESNKSELDDINAELARTYIAKGLYQEGLRLCEEVEDKRMRTKIEGEIYIKIHLWQKAEEVLSLAEGEMQLNLNTAFGRYCMKNDVVPRYPRTMKRIYHGLKGRIAYERGDFDLAIAHLEQAKRWCVSLHHEDLAYYADALALACFMKGDMGRARDEFQSIGSMTYGRKHYGDIYAKSYYMLGKVFEQLGEKREAKKNYEQFLEIWKNADPGLPEVDDAQARLKAL